MITKNEQRTQRKVYKCHFSKKINLSELCGNFAFSALKNKISISNVLEGPASSDNFNQKCITIKT